MWNYRILHNSQFVTVFRRQLPKLNAALYDPFCVCFLRSRSHITCCLTDRKVIRVSFEQAFTSVLDWNLFRLISAHLLPFALSTLKFRLIDIDLNCKCEQPLSTEQGRWSFVTFKSCRIVVLFYFLKSMWRSLSSKCRTFHNFSTRI